ncbi:hypothetical protein LCGC14_1000390, partial [marine sediment metagenome]
PNAIDSQGYVKSQRDFSENLAILMKEKNSLSEQGQAALERLLKKLKMLYNVA